jgi:ATP-dependent exoDNAse (exonuclease V) beta subunit
VERLKHVFADKGLTTIKFMTGHKSKGLQAPKVWLLRPDLIPHYYSLGTPWMEEEEKRLMYVINTRAQESFYYVDEPYAGKNKRL